MPTLVDRRPPLAKGIQTNIAGKDVVESTRQKITQLSGQDSAVAARAAAALVMLATRQEASQVLPAAVSPLVSLLSSPDTLCKENACAALTSIMAVNQKLYCLVATTDGLGPAVVDMLEGAERESSSAAMCINSGAAIAALAQGDEGLLAVQNANAVEALVSLLCSSLSDERVLEAALDAICALAAHEVMRPSLVSKGTVEGLARQLKAHSTEVQVRALLALGMLIGSNESAQALLANADGAAGALVLLARSGDPDVRMVAGQVFGTLARNQALKFTLGARLREFAVASAQAA